MAELKSNKGMAMAPQSACFRVVSIVVLALGISFLRMPVAHAADPGASQSEYERFCNPPSGPPRDCPPTRPRDPARPVPPEAIEKMLKDLERAKHEDEAEAKPTPLTGIFGPEFNAPFSSAYFIENQWHEIVAGKRYSVYAGSMRFDPADDSIVYDPATAHGFAIIIKGKLGEPGTRSNQLYTPNAVGALQIISANGLVLTLQSRQGKMFKLNVESERLTPIGKQ